MGYEETFATRDDLQKYGSNALLLFALELRFQIEDIHTVAVDALTDGSNDKKCDLIYVDADGGFAVIAQAYYSANPRSEAPANKASDLNTAASWLLHRGINDLPEKLRPAATQLRSAVTDGQIHTLQFWYVHNSPQSKNVRDELRTVEATASSALNTLVSGISGLNCPDVIAIEVGQEALTEWYQSLTNPILVSDNFEIDVPGGFSINSADWSAFVTSVPAKWLFQVYQVHKSELFSANVRNYLGSRDAAANINNGIKNTALQDAEHFWPFNNGLTILVNKFDYKQRKRKLHVSGVSIVNGAQTTGALGSLGSEPDEKVMVPARFVACHNADTVMDIIKYNNSQNKVEPSDFRSNDIVQQRLRNEFHKINSVVYLGGKRGGHEDRIKRPANLLPSETAGQALAAFHGEPVVAYNEKSRIWISDSIYSRYFSEKTTARHIIFAISLLRAIESRKRVLVERSLADELTESEHQQLSFLRERGASFLLTSAIASCIETIAGKRVPSTFILSFGDSTTPQIAEKYWEPIVTSCMAFAYKLLPAVEKGLKNNDLVGQTIKTFQALVEATKGANSSIFSAFHSRIVDK